MHIWLLLISYVLRIYNCSICECSFQLNTRILSIKHKGSIGLTGCYVEYDRILCYNNRIYVKIPILRVQKNLQRNVGIGIFSHISLVLCFKISNLCIVFDPAVGHILRPFITVPVVTDKASRVLVWLVMRDFVRVCARSPLNSSSRIKWPLSGFTAGVWDQMTLRELAVDTALYWWVTDENLVKMARCFQRTVFVRASISCSACCLLITRI